MAKRKSTSKSNKSRQSSARKAANVRAWLLDQREQLVSYLKAQRVKLTERPVPEWELAPCIAVWSIPGGWAISGDLPTDYICDQRIPGPREALLFFSMRFAEAASCMCEGRRHSEVSIGDPSNLEEQKELGAMLQSRAELLRQFVEDEELWPPELAEWQERLE